MSHLWTLLGFTEVLRDVVKSSFTDAIDITTPREAGSPKWPHFEFELALGKKRFCVKVFERKNTPLMTGGRTDG